MAPNLLFDQLLLVALVLICLIMHVGWPDPPSPTPRTPLKSDTPRRQRSKAPKPFPGLIHQPLCDACAQHLDIRRSDRLAVTWRGGMHGTQPEAGEQIEQSFTHGAVHRREE